MTYKVSYYAKSENQKEDILIVTFWGDYLMVQINEKSININLNRAKGLFKEYNEQSFNGNDYKSKELFKDLINNEDSTTIINIFRAFAVMDNYLHYADTSLYKDIKRRIDSIKEFFYHSSLIDWTGKLGSQPVMYLLKKEHSKQSLNDLKDLYELSILCKIRIDYKDDFIENYFVPFELSNVNNLKIFRVRKTWNKIVHDMNEELSKFDKE